MIFGFICFRITVKLSSLSLKFELSSRSCDDHRIFVFKTFIQLGVRKIRRHCRLHVCATGWRIWKWNKVDFIRSSRVRECTRFYDSEFRKRFSTLVQAIKNIWDVRHWRVCLQKTTRKFAGDFCWGSISPPRVLNEAYINKRSFFPQTILAKSLGTLSQKPCKFAHPPSTPNAMLIWSALHTQNHCRCFQHCLGWEGGGQWQKQCDINRKTHLRKAFFTNVQFCACFCSVSHGLLARIEGVGNIISPFITFTLFLGDRALQKLGCGVFSQSLRFDTKIHTKAKCANDWFKNTD